MKNCFFTLLANAIFLTTVHAQDNKIETDRPGETQTTKTTKIGFLQAEAGFRKEQENETDYTLFHPRAQLKYGLTKKVELRAELSGASEKSYSTAEFRYGLLPVELGFKAALTEQQNILPAISLYTQVGIPNWASKDHQQEKFLPKLRMLFENKLTDKLKLGYNAGAEWQGDGSGPQWLYTIAPQIELSEKWEAFVETFAYFKKGELPQHHVDGGFAFYPANNIKLDLWGGKGISEESLNYFISLGVSFRLKP